MTRKTRLLLSLVVLAALLAATGILLLPHLLDVNRYRTVIENRAGAALGRPVRVGELDLSLLPVLGLRVDDLALGALPEEGPDDLLTAERLRIGARLWPLLRGRLEVRSVLLEQPVLHLGRGPDGEWSLPRLVAREGTGEDGGRRPQLSVARLRVTGGRIHVLDAYPSPTDPVEITLTGVEGELEDFALDRSFRFTAASGFAAAPAARLRVKGEAGPLAGEGPSSLTARWEAEDIPPQLVAEMVRSAGWEVEPLLGDRPIGVSARIHATLGSALSIELSEVVARRLDLRLQRSRAGIWNLPPQPVPAAGAHTEPGEPVAGSSLLVRDLRIEDGRLRVAVTRDEERQPAVAVVDRVGLRLQGMPTETAAQLDLSAELRTGQEAARIEGEGQVGPLRSKEGLSVDLQISARELSVAWLRDLLGESGALAGVQGTARLDVRAAGALPEELQLSGDASLEGLVVHVETPEGRQRRLSMELGAHFDLSSERSGDSIRIPSLELTVDGRRLEIDGSLTAAEGGRRVDLTLQPVRLPADDLLGLAALLYPDLQVSASSPELLEIGAQMHGTIGKGSLPEVEGRLAIADVRLIHPSLGRPIDSLSGEIRFGPERLRARDVRASFGSSDLSGEMTIEGFEEPEVAFDLRSARARFDEILTLLDRGARGAGSDRASVDPSGLLKRVSATGSIAVDSGSWGSLDFSGLTSSVELEKGTLTLDPVASSLYDGTFEGRVVIDLRRSPPPFTLDGEARGVEVRSFLADNLDVHDRLAGRFSGAVRAQGELGAFETLVGSLEGEGRMTLEEGRVEGFRLLGAVADVAGVFGQRTLARIAGRLAEAATRFQTLRGSFRVEDGRLVLDQVALESSDYAVSGSTSVDLLSREVRGDGVMAFSRALSELMHGEQGSRAGELFWNPETGQVLLPFSLRGVLEEPRVSVDWEQAVRGFTERRVEREVRDLVEEALGIDRGRETPPPAPPATPPPQAAEDLRAAVTSTRWRGSILAQDLEIVGTVSGARLARASVRLSDASGRELGRIAPLPELETHLATSPEPEAPATVDWRVRFDGKRLLLARFPLTAEVTVEDRDGNRAVTDRLIEE